MARLEDILGYHEWNKLVRDKVPSRFPVGTVASVEHVGNGDHLVSLLVAKLEEECKEVAASHVRHVATRSGIVPTSGEAERARQAKNALIGELIDVLEVAFSALGYLDVSEEAASVMRAEKERTHGAFMAGVFLRWTRGPDSPTQTIGKSFEIWHGGEAVCRVTPAAE